MAMLVRTVEQARHDVGVPRGFRAALTVGGRFGLWEQLLLKWLPLMLKVAPDIAVRAEIGLEADLMQGLVEGRLDIGVTYTPQSRPGLKVEPLLEERLVLVSTDPNRRPEPGPGYVYICNPPQKSSPREEPSRCSLAFCADLRCMIADHWGAGQSFVILGAILIVLCVPVTVIIRRAARTATQAEPALSD
jgi:DNA-binding transcriptional LysR family regulator